MQFILSKYPVLLINNKYSPNILSFIFAMHVPHCKQLKINHYEKQTFFLRYFNAIINYTTGKRFYKRAFV